MGQNDTGNRIPLKVILVADGPVDDPRTNSGVSCGLARALDSASGVEVVARVSTALSPFQRAVHALATFSINRQKWKSRFRHSRRSIRVRSSNRDRQIRRVPLSEDADFVVHIRNIYHLNDERSVVFIDTTTALSSGWGGWEVDPKIREHEQREFNTARFVFTAGKEAAASVIDDYRIERNKVGAIGGGINFEPLPELNLRESAITGDYPLKVLFVGYDFERKGGWDLVAAVSEIADAGIPITLTIVGARPHVSHPSIRVIGRIDNREELANYYRDADVFCLLSRHEPYGLVLQEAMAFGLASIVTDVGELGAIAVDGTTGIVIPPEDPSALKAALRLLHESRGLTADMGRAARARAEESFRWSNVAQRLCDRLEYERDRWRAISNE